MKKISLKDAKSLRKKLLRAKISWRLVDLKNTVTETLDPGQDLEIFVPLGGAGSDYHPLSQLSRAAAIVAKHIGRNIKNTDPGISSHPKTKKPCLYMFWG